jgi:hypothetical protein
VERRKEPRIALDSPVRLSILGDDRKLEIPGRIVDLSGKALKVATQVPLPCGTLVKAELFDTLLLGEVCRSAEGDNCFHVVVQVSHSLSSLPELERLNAALHRLGEPEPEKEPVAVKPRRASLEGAPLGQRLARAR